MYRDKDGVEDQSRIDSRDQTLKGEGALVLLHPTKKNQDVPGYPSFRYRLLL